MKRLNYTDRKRISFLLQKGQTPYSIAKDLGFNRSTIIREINRNSSDDIYNPRKAHLNALKRSFRGVAKPKLPQDILFYRTMKKLYYMRLKAKQVYDDWEFWFENTPKPCKTTFYNFYNKSFPKIVFMEELYREEEI